LNQLKKDLSALESELNAYGVSNPAKVEEAKRAAFLAKEGAYRWTGMRSIFPSLFCTDWVDVKITIVLSSVIL
jgi:hypothetical protein